MQTLKVVPKLNNTETDCPVRAGHCELLYNAEKMCVLLRLSLLTLEPKPDVIYVDICCYDQNGRILSVMKDIEYGGESELFELSSVLTAAVRIIVRRVVYPGGNVWESKSEYQKEIEFTPEEVQNIGDTVRFDTAAVAKAAMKAQGEKVRGKMLKAEKKARRLEKRAEEEEIISFIKHDPKERKRRIIARSVIFLIFIGICLGGYFGISYKTEADSAYKKAMNLYNGGRYEEALPELESARKYRYFGNTEKELMWALAICYASEENLGPAVVHFKNLGSYKESRSNYRNIIEGFAGTISAGGAHTLGLRSSGTVIAAGDNSAGQCDVGQWSDIIAVTAGGKHSVGLKRDGTVVAAGSNENGQRNVLIWDNIISVSAGDTHTVGVLNIGKVVATGDNSFGQCEVGDWSGIVAVDAGVTHTVGLKLDGTVVAAGSNLNGECEVSGWTDMVQVTAGNGFTAGLKADGTVLLCGRLQSVAEGRDEKKIRDVEPKDVLAISAGEYNLLITTTDGRTVSVGGNDSHQGSTSLWTDVAAAAGGTKHSAAVKSDGSAVASGDGANGRTMVDSWSGIGIPASSVKIYKGNDA